MNVNIKGAWLCSCAVLPFMKLQKYGKIINQSSNVFHLGFPTMPITWPAGLQLWSDQGHGERAR